MLIPVRCFTCGKVLGNRHDAYQNLLSKGKSSEEALNAIGLTNSCCRRAMYTHVDVVERMIVYRKASNVRNSKRKRSEEEEEESDTLV